MSIRIIKKGLSDRIVDQGRYGYQDLGIQPSGPMDFLSAQLANTILGNELSNPVFELHFPAAVFEFEQTMLICISGANFVPVINDKSIALNTPIEVYPKDQLSFLKPIEGRTAYVAFKGKLNNRPSWLNSYSSFQTTLQKEDHFKIETVANKNHTDPSNDRISDSKDLIYNVHNSLFKEQSIHFIPGPAWKDLDPFSIQVIMDKPFSIDSKSNRMGFLLNGEKINLTAPKEYTSSAVTRGTLQLLPNGQIIVLMADHQTIGGYANLGQIILVDLPRLAQLNNQSQFKLSITNVQTAHQLYRAKQSCFKH
jgi:antagonist of KipI